MHASAKARLTSVAIRIRGLDRHQSLIICSLSRCQPSLKISYKSVWKLEDKQRQKHILLGIRKKRKECKISVKPARVCVQGTKKSACVTQGAAENLALAVSTELSLKDSAKSDSTGGGRLVDGSVQSDSVTPKSAVDSATSEVSLKPSVSGHESTSHASDDKSGVISVNTTSAASDPPFDVISLLHSGQTLRYSRLAAFVDFCPCRSLAEVMFSP